MDLDRAQKIIAGKDIESSLFYFEGPRQTTLLDSEFTPHRYNLFDFTVFLYSGHIYHNKKNLTNKEGKYTLYFDDRKLGGPYTEKQLFEGIKCAQKKFLKLIPEIEIKQQITTKYKETATESPNGLKIHVDISGPFYHKLKKIAYECFESGQDSENIDSIHQETQIPYKF